MNKIALLVGVLLGMQSPLAHAGPGWGFEKFQKVFWLEAGGKGSESGKSASNAKDFEDGDLMAIDAGTVIERVYVIGDVAVAGLSLVEIGDDDDADGFVVNVAAALATPGMYSYSAADAGAYLIDSSNSSSVYRVGQGKHYAAAGKEVKINVTGSVSAGKARVIVEGFKSTL